MENITAAGRRRRYLCGSVFLLAGGTGAVALSVTGAPVVLRLLLALPIGLGLLGLFQAKEGT